MSQQSPSPSLFKLPNYLAWFGADTFLLAGSAVHWVVVSLVAYQLSGSVTLAGWFATARGIMSVITQVTGGAFIDRHDHRKLILVQAGSCGVIWATMGVLFATHLLNFWLFAGLCLTSSAIYGFLGGTTNAALIRVVGPERYAEAESLNQGRDAAVNMAGSPLGAALFGVFPAGTFFASAVCDALAFISATFLRLPPIKAPDSEEDATPKASFLHDLVEGWRWVFASRTIVIAVFIIGLSEFGQFAVMQALNLNLAELGIEPLLISAVNLGAGLATMLGSLISTRVCNRVPTGKGVVAILFMVALSYLPMALLGTYPAMMLSQTLARLPMPLFNALVMGFVFSKTPVDRQGRTRAAVMTTVMLISSGAGGLAGELLPRIGFGGFVFVMIGLMLLAALCALASRRVRSIPASPEWPRVEL